MKSQDKLVTLCSHKAVAPSWRVLSRQKSYATKQQPFSIYYEKFGLGARIYQPDLLGCRGSLGDSEIAEVGFLRRGVSRSEHKNLAALLGALRAVQLASLDDQNVDLCIQ
jgi:hypothetical protein